MPAIKRKEVNINVNNKHLIIFYEELAELADQKFIEGNYILYDQYRQAIWRFKKNNPGIIDHIKI